MKKAVLDIKIFSGGQFIYQIHANKFVVWLFQRFITMSVYDTRSRKVADEI